MIYGSCICFTRHIQSMNDLWKLYMLYKAYTIYEWSMEVVYALQGIHNLWMIYGSCICLTRHTQSMNDLWKLYMPYKAYTIYEWSMEVVYALQGIHNLWMIYGSCVLPHEACSYWLIWMSDFDTLKSVCIEFEIRSPIGRDENYIMHSLYY